MIQNPTPQINFGAIDTQTGETYEGYLDKENNMQFKRKPWWKRIFSREEIYVEKYLGTVPIDFQANRNVKWEKTKIALYCKLNKFTREVVELYCFHYGVKYNFDMNAFQKDGILIQL